jgi:hypothetical protein
MPQEGRSPPTTMPGDRAPGRTASPPRGSDSAPQKLTKAGEATPKRPSHENRPRTVHGPPTSPAPGIAPALHIKVPVGVLGAGAARLGAGAAPHVRLARSPDDRVRASSPSCSPAGNARTWALIEARGGMPAPRLRRHSWTRSPAAAWIASPGLPCGSSASRAGADAAATYAAEFFRRSRPRGRRLSAGAFWSGVPGAGARADESASRRPTTRIRPGRASPQDQRQGHPPLGPPAGYGLLPRLDRDAIHVLVPAGHVPSGGRDAECGSRHRRRRPRRTGSGVRRACRRRPGRGRTRSSCPAPRRVDVDPSRAAPFDGSRTRRARGGAPLVVWPEYEHATSSGIASCRSHQRWRLSHPRAVVWRSPRTGSRARA